MFRSRARHYPTCLQAALDGDNIPVSVYGNLVAQIRERLPVLHRYFRLRARALGVPHLTYHDLHCPIAEGPRASYTVEQAAELVRESMAPLGSRYAEPLRRAFEDRWIDWHPVPGKRSGAYASGSAYDVHPFMLLNFNGDYESVSTLAHEVGHAMHSYFSNRTQPYPTADYSIFVAEVASTFNEAMLQESLMKRAADREEKLFLLSGQLDGFRATLFRQTMFAEFELLIHEKVERGESLTGEALSAALPRPRACLPRRTTKGSAWWTSGTPWSGPWSPTSTTTSTCTSTPPGSPRPPRSRRPCCPRCPARASAT